MKAFSVAGGFAVGLWMVVFLAERVPAQQDSGVRVSPRVTDVSRTGNDLRVEWEGSEDGIFQVEAAAEIGEPFSAISPELSRFSFVDAPGEAVKRYYRIVDLTLGAPFETASSEAARIEPQLEDGELAALADGNGDFAFRFYRRLASDSKSVGSNLFASPYSISLAFAMTYAGARGDTAAEMAAALGFTQPPERVHESFNGLAGELAGRGSSIADPDDRFRLNVVNDTWGQKGFSFVEDYLDTLAMHYGAGMNLLDFTGDPGGARVIINQWIASQTNDRIVDLMPESSIDEATRLVLTNAIYFKAKWENPFNKNLTSGRPFLLKDGAEISADMMFNRSDYPVAKGDGYTAVELPYKGEELSMMIVMPDQGGFDAFEGAVDYPQVAAIASSLKPTDVELSLPRFTFNQEIELNPIMTDLGMVKAFSGGQADFSGISAQFDLFIQSAIHKAFVAVDEEGTEAAAATGISIGITSLPEQIKIDKPFLFVLRDRATGTILFIGRVLDPGPVNFTQGGQL